MTIRPIPVLAAAVLAFIVGELWYSPLLFGNVYLRLRGLDPAANTDELPMGEVIAEFLRWLIVSVVFAFGVARLRAASRSQMLVYALLLWAAMYAAAGGAVVHEGYDWRLYAIHAGDGLVKMLLIGTILARSMVMNVPRRGDPAHVV